MIKDILKNEKIKSYVSFNDNNFPFIINYQGKEYVIRYTIKGGLQMTGYIQDKNFIQTNIKKLE